MGLNEIVIRMCISKRSLRGNTNTEIAFVLAQLLACYRYIVQNVLNVHSLQSFAIYRLLKFVKLAQFSFSPT